MTLMSRCGSEFQRRRTESTEPGKFPASFFLMEVRFVEYFSMAQGRHAVVSRCSLPEVPHAHPVCPRPQRRSRKTPGSVGGKTDRKSTRLNSSHLVISYAVFCLKKKKDKRPHPAQPKRSASRAEWLHKHDRPSP